MLSIKAQHEMLGVKRESGELHLGMLGVGNEPWEKGKMKPLKKNTTKK
jgi:hypothetical protein